jgi:hypothetical protein
LNIYCYHGSLFRISTLGLFVFNEPFPLIDGELKLNIPPRRFEADGEAWSSGQISSKLWLCEIIEREFESSQPIVLWVYGSWYGMLPFLLLTRERIGVRSLGLFDLDPEALHISRGILENWMCFGFEVSFFQVDCNDLRGDEPFYSQNPNLIVNSSCEHFSSRDWLKNIPAGIKVLLQSTDMEHQTHLDSPRSLEDFKRQVSPFVEILWAGERVFRYPGRSFFRFTIFGRRCSTDDADTQNENSDSRNFL